MMNKSSFFKRCSPSRRNRVKEKLSIDLFDVDGFIWLVESLERKKKILLID